MSDCISLIDFWRYRLKKQGKNCIVRPCHEFKAQALTKLVMGKLDTPNLMILEPPRIGKTDLGVRSFTPWSGSYFPDSEFILGGYNQDLPNESLADIRNTFASPWYRQMVGSDWGVRMRMRGNKLEGKADYFRTLDDGVYKAVGRGGGATGFGAGKLRPEFGGAIVCFPYCQKILTEIGPIKIGDIVKNELPVKIVSKNIKTGMIDLKPIDSYFKNPGSDIYEITFDNGASIKCTPDHKIYTENRGYVQAIDLLKSDTIEIFKPDSINRRSGNIKLSCNKSFWESKIANKINIFVRKVLGPILPRISFASLFCNIGPCVPYLNTPNSGLFNAIFFRNNRCLPSIQNNSYGLRFSKFGTRALFVHRESPMPFGIGYIFRSCPIFKIFNNIVSWISVKMPYLHSLRSRAKESQSHSRVEIHAKKFSIYAALKNSISLSILTFCFKDFFFQSIRGLIRPVYNSFLAFGSSHTGNTISGITRNIHPNFIRKIGHNSSTYCLNIRHNHNMYIGDNQYILASNCDDVLKAQEANSNAAMKEANTWIEETIQSRRNRLSDPMTPIILIMQRLHPNDPAGYLLKTQRHRWTVVQIPAHNEKWESIWPEKISVDELKHMRDFNPDLYYSQYMQNPSDDGFIIFRSEWWLLWDNIAEVEKRITHKFIVADTAFKAKDSADFSVFQCWGCEGTSGLYLLDQVRGKWEFPDLLKEATKFKDKHIARKMGITPATEFWIEDKASGTSLVQSLRKNGVGAKEWKPSQKTSQDKVGRAKACTDSIYNERVLIPDPDLPDHRWVDIFVAEHTAFTADDSHVNDDQVDGTTMAISIWKEKGGGTGPLPTWNVKKRLKNVKTQIYTLQ